MYNVMLCTMIDVIVKFLQKCKLFLCFCSLFEKETIHTANSLTIHPDNKTKNNPTIFSLLCILYSVKSVL